MSASSRTRSGTNSTKVLSVEQTSPSKAKPVHPENAELVSKENQDQIEMESKKVAGAKGKGKSMGTALKRPKGTRAAAKKMYCVCKQPDDGTPMVNCSECKNWSVTTNSNLMLILS